MSTSQPFQFTASHAGEDITVNNAVFQALSAASMCWDSVQDAGSFHSTRAKQIGDTLLIYIRTHYAAAVTGEMGDNGSGADVILQALADDIRTGTELPLSIYRGGSLDPNRL